MNKRLELSQLAINGGPKTRITPFPTRHNLGVDEKKAVDELFDEAIRSGNAFGYNGKAEENYCNEFAEFMGGGYADAVNSGTTAVFVALKALGIEPFTEVIVSSVTDPGGMMPIVMLNCIPVVADSAPGKYNTDAEQIEKLISPLTSAIVVAHIGGEPADMEGIMAVAKKYGIPVVEDCAQSHYAKLNGKLVGTFGDIGAFSTMFGKHFCTGGQGGVVFTKNEDLYYKIRQAADRGKPFGLPAGSTNCVASLNFNLNDLAATIGSVQLKKLPSIVEARRKVVAQLKEGFKDLQSIIIPEQLPNAEPSYWWWRLKVNVEKLSCDKASYCKALMAEGIPINPRYDGALPFTMDWFKNQRAFGSSNYPWSASEYKGNSNRKFDCPNTFKSIDTQFNLIVFESWGQEEVDDIIAAFKKLENAYIK